MTYGLIFGSLHVRDSLLVKLICSHDSLVPFMQVLAHARVDLVNIVHLHNSLLLLTLLLNNPILLAIQLIKIVFGACVDAEVLIQDD